MNDSEPTKHDDLPFPKMPQFEVIAELGRGGMGVVYEARQLNLNRTVALKMVLAGEHASQTARARFLQEAEIAARLKHPNIVQIYELGEHQGLPFFVMEKVEGGSLPRRVARTTEDYRALAILLQKLASAVHHAHSHGIIHRDLKPGNILMTAEGEPKITDFGLAKLMDTSGEKAPLTITGAMMGTPAYMAPEQALGELSIGPPTDIYALGVLLYEQLAGDVPFRGASEMEILHKIAHDEPVSPSWKNPGTPRNLEVICMKCLRKKAPDRYATAEDLAADLGRYLRGEPIKAKPIGALRKAYYWAKRRPRRIAAALLCLLGLAAGGVWWRHQLLYEWESQSYHELFAIRWGSYEGTGRTLTKEEVAKCARSFRIIRKGREGRVVRMETVDSSATITPFANSAPFILEALGLMPTSTQECIYVLTHNPDGSLKEERVLTLNGSIVRRLEYSYSQPKEGANAMTQGRIRFTSPDAASLPAATGVAQLEFVRNAEGRDVSMRFLDATGNPRAAGLGISGFQSSYDERGRQSSLQCIDENNQPAKNTEGWCRWRLVYGDFDRTKEMIVLDEKDQPALWFGFHRCLSDFDAHGNLIASHYLGTDGKPNGEYEQQYGEPVRLAFARHTAPGRPTTETRWDWSDDRSFVKSVRYLDAKNAPYYTEDGQSLEKHFYDAQSRLTRQENSGYDTQEMNFARFIKTQTWDGDRLKSTASWVEDAGGKKVRYEDGYTDFFEEYDSLRRLIRKVYSGYDGSEDYPYFKETVTYQWKEGASTMSASEYSYFDQEDKPVRHEDGYLFNRDEYDEQGRTAREIYRGYAPESSPYFTSIVEIEWQGSKDEEPKFKTWRYLDKDDKPARAAGGYLTERNEYDDNGRLLRSTYDGFLPEKFPYARSITVNFWEKPADEHPPKWIIYYQDETGRPARNELGAQEMEETRMPDGSTMRWLRGCDPEKWPSTSVRITESRNGARNTTLQRIDLVDEKGKSVRSPEGYTTVVKELDEKGRMVGRTASGYLALGLAYDAWVEDYVFGEGDTVKSVTTRWQDAAGTAVRDERGVLQMTMTDNGDQSMTLLLEGIDESAWGYSQLVATTRKDGEIATLHRTTSKGAEITKVEVVIARVLPDSPAAKSDLQKGDVLLRYADHDITTSLDFSRVPKNGGFLVIRRAGTEKTIGPFEPGNVGLMCMDRAKK